MSNYDPAACWVCSEDLEHNCNGKPPGEDPKWWYDGMDCTQDDCHGTMRWTTDEEFDARWRKLQAARKPDMTCQIMDGRADRPIENNVKGLPQRIHLNGEPVPFRIEGQADGYCRLFFGRGVEVSVGDKVEVWYPK